MEPAGDGLYQPALAKQPGWVRHWDALAEAPFLWNAERRIFIGFDDPEALRIKGRYIRDHGLAGAMFWEYKSDPTGDLLGTLFSELRGERAAPAAATVR